MQIISEKFPRTGIAGINLESLDPMLVTEAKVVERAGPVKVDGKSTNTIIKGYSKAKISQIGGFERNKMEIKFKVPTLHFNGTYEAQASILGIPVNGGGPYTVVFSKNNYNS